MPTVKDMIGRKFGRLTVVRYAGQNKHRKANWECLCSCGNKTVVCGNSLRSGLTKSCRCFQKEAAITHGESRTRNGRGSYEYRVWAGIISRCRVKTASGYANYGGRGIQVCARWLLYSNFIEDMGHRPSPKHSIDRSDNDGNYEPGNCRWVTKKEQDRNRRTNRVLEFNGERKCLTAWAEERGLHPAALSWRLDNGWSIKLALTTKSRRLA